MKLINNIAAIVLAAHVSAVTQEHSNEHKGGHWLDGKPEGPPNSHHHPTATDHHEPHASPISNKSEWNFKGEDHRFNARDLTGHPHAVIVTEHDRQDPVGDKHERGHERRAAPPPLGIYGCCIPQFKGDCTWHSLAPGQCQSFDCVQEAGFGSSLGPDKGVNCEVFADKGCQGKSIKNWLWGRPEAADTGTLFWVSKGFAHGIQSYRCGYNKMKNH